VAQRKAGKERTMNGSEQQEGLELSGEPPLDDPKAWRRHDPDRVRENGDVPEGVQLTTPDDESGDAAEEHGRSVTAGPEQQAVHETE
jgi:hypothetical protein